MLYTTAEFEIDIYKYEILDQFKNAFITYRKILDTQ